MAKWLITSLVYADNRKKQIQVIYTDGTVGFFGFDVFDKKLKKVI